MSRPELIGAIQNAGDNLRADLVRHMLEDNYKGIYILGGGKSTAEVLQNFEKSDVKLVHEQGREGPIALRNLVLGIAAVKPNSIIHFINGDMDLETTEVPEKAKDFLSGSVAFTGGLINDPNGRPSIYNYGPRQTLKNDWHALLQFRIAVLAETNLEQAKELRQKNAEKLKDWPNPFELPTTRATDWSSEDNLFMSSELFSRIGGFDSRLSHHGIIEMARRLDVLGYKLERRFDPIVSASYKTSEGGVVLDGIRRQAATLKIAREYGLTQYLTPKKSAAADK